MARQGLEFGSGSGPIAIPFLHHSLAGAEFLSLMVNIF